MRLSQPRPSSELHILSKKGRKRLTEGISQGLSLERPLLSAKLVLLVLLLSFLELSEEGIA